MSPFREVPLVELGPLDVGLAGAAERAARRLPRGGRVVTPAASADATRGDTAHRARRGALGSAGLLFLVAGTLVAWGSGWRPARIEHLAPAIPALVLGVLVGGASLALVFRAMDRGDPTVVQRGYIIGQRAGSVLRSLAGLEAHAHRAFVDPRSIHWLRRVLVAAADADIEPWIPADVRGRAELLLAREIAAYQGAAFGNRRVARGEVAALLIAAAGHLDDASPAREDLAVLDQSPHLRVHRKPGARRSELGSALT